MQNMSMLYMSSMEGGERPNAASSSSVEIKAFLSNWS